MKATDKLQAILNGWRHVVFKNEEVEKLAKARAVICSTCPSNVNDKCAECGCPLVSKLRSVVNNDCPLGKWDNLKEE